MRRGSRRWILRGLLVLAGAVMATVGALAIGGAGAASRDARPHLVVVPSTPAGHAALQLTSARRIARYASFTLVEARGADVDRLLAAGGDRRDDMRDVQIGSVTSDPATARPALATKAAARTAARPGLALVQFVGPVKDAWRAALAKQGVDIVTYMAENAELVYGDAAAMDRLESFAGEPFVRAITPYVAADKRAPGLAATGTHVVTVSTVAGAGGGAARRRAAASGSGLGDPVTIGAITQRRYRLSAADAAALADDPGVVAVEPFVAPKLLDERDGQIIAGNVDSSFRPIHGNGYLSFLAAMGIKASATTVDITDEGVDKGVVPVPAGSHPDFYKNGNPVNPSRIVYDHEATAGDANARDCGGHGTNVASIATGYNKTSGATTEDAQGFQYGLGIDPFAKLGATKIFNCAGNFDVQTSLTALAGSAYASGARVSNNSWGASTGGAYGADSREEDAIVRDAQPGVSGNQQLAEIFSAGNSGAGANTTGSPGTAKNVLTVGAAEGVRPIGGTDGCGVPDTGANSARDIIDFSSRGPTDDGRIKPDIVAPGTHVSGAQPQTGADYNGSGTCNPQFPAGSLLYSLVSGTSQAAPEVTGLSSLVRTWYHQQYNAFPSPAMNKALIANAATDLSGGNDGAGGTLGHAPDQIQGWGRVNFRNIAGSGVPRSVFDQRGPLDHAGDSSTKHFRIVSASKRLRVTLAWTDAPGPTTGNAFVNNVDLVVTAGGQTYKGNVMSGGLSATGGAADPRNNLENVVLPTGATGPVTVKVIGSNIVGNGVPGNADPTDQDFALVVTNANPTATTSNLTSDGTTISDTAGGDGDGHAEPGETVRVAQKLRNVGNAAATGVSGTLTENTDQAQIVDGGPKNWANLAPGATGANASPFSVALGAGLPCGAPVSIVAHIATASGDHYNLQSTVPTGAGPGSATNLTSTDVPKAIPDNNPVGVTSNLTVGGAGRVADVNVKISSLAHTWDGDLKIDVIAPNGTDVILANRPGGALNSGDNFTDTVFDDSAAQTLGTGNAPPYTGTFRPQADQLSRLNGINPQGTWKLKVADLAAADTGTLGGWGTTTRRFACG